MMSLNQIHWLLHFLLGGGWGLPCFCLMVEHQEMGTGSLYCANPAQVPQGAGSRALPRPWILAAAADRYKAGTKCPLSLLPGLFTVTLLGLCCSAFYYWESIKSTFTSPLISMLLSFEM